MKMYRNNKTMIAVLLATICLACPCIIATIGGESDADLPSTETNDLREALETAGYETDEYTDEELIEEFGWFANKNLIGKYDWDDPTGINWLLEKAGVEGSIDDIILGGQGVSLIVSGATYALTGALLSAGVVGWLVAAGAFVYGVYSSIMQENALQKVEVALNLVSQQKNYAVYETTVMWNAVPNGYEVEEWK